MYDFVRGHLKCLTSTLNSWKRLKLDVQCLRFPLYSEKPRSSGTLSQGQGLDIHVQHSINQETVTQKLSLVITPKVVNETGNQTVLSQQRYVHVFYKHQWFPLRPQSRPQKRKILGVQQGRDEKILGPSQGLQKKNVSWINIIWTKNRKVLQTRNMKVEFSPPHLHFPYFWRRQKEVNPHSWSPGYTIPVCPFICPLTCIYCCTLLIFPQVSPFRAVFSKLTLSFIMLKLL